MNLEIMNQFKLLDINQEIVKTGGVAMVYDEQQLINEELADPLKREKGRQNILNNETGPYHGKSGRKIAQLILNA